MIINLKPEDADKYIYRIISMEHLTAWFENRENVMVKPNKWDDPFENFILRSKVKLPEGNIIEYPFHDSMYGQCWSLHKASDAMWRIYSKEKLGLRVRTTIRGLITSLARHHGRLPQATCAIGKVRYLKTRDIEKQANQTFNDSGLAVDKIFESLLFKRMAFKHENEVRLLYCELDQDACGNDLHKYEIDPNELISQIMIDPRLSEGEAREIKSTIKAKLKFKGDVKRSMLYAPPKILTVGTTGSI
ncbi:hypothetical protein BLA3211_00792 [Burkholderia aenigmatica]|uniref:DUF2971 domain-containing protein n=2 Tax=Burkholderiaceae TaxID=119060 RepID=A0A6J5ISP8_9BURK|nr:hypothetical protein BLA3211_00792 [Burkholderia aenigmatica]